jgi:6-phosphogluconolactonase/glucosamine-6-phosphate isomerase/deaminase
MSLNIKKAAKAEEVAKFIALSVLNQLKSGKNVLLFLTGGSSVDIGVKISDLLKKHDCKNLTIMLTDERYGKVGHPDSNWQQLIEQGFDLPQANLVPVLTGDDLALTTEKFNENLAYEFNIAHYRIGLFGIGLDGHTAGILHDSVALKSTDLVCGYETPKFSRITITPNLIENLDEAVVFLRGEEKWPVLEDFKKNIDIMKMPAQVLKKVPLLTVFTDNPGSRT